MTTLPQTIGQYPIERELGRGGMGVVYLARDPRLDRHVAIKVLPEAFAQDPERLARFQREARLLAALNHRNVASIYGLEETDGHQLLVLEYVPGQTLSQRLQSGPMPLDETVKVSAQVAEGLEAAHERDVVHRDLKPDNIRITPEGIVKILDFGLATSAPPSARPVSEATTSLTRATAITAISHPGMVMGTPGYMSPEQARGLAVDKRTDIWSFACMLYECLTGTLMFGGSTVGDFIAAVLEREPDWSALPARVPPRIKDLLRRCTVKDPRRRLRDIGDARIELEELLATPVSGWFKGAAPSAAAPGGGGGGAAATAARSRPVLRLSLSLPAEFPLANTRRGSMALSPDGGTLAYISVPPGEAGGGRPVLCVRRMDQIEVRSIPGTAGAEAPFFSPDSQQIAFFASGKLKKIPLSGGSPVTLADAPAHGGGAWDSTGIYFVADVQHGLSRVAPTGGATSTVARIDPLSGQRAILHPSILPGSRAAMVTIVAGPTFADAQIAAVNLQSGAITTILHGGSQPRPAGGSLVYTSGGSLMAVPFDFDRLSLAGSGSVALEKVLGHSLGGVVQAAISSDGTLISAEGPVFAPTSTLMCVPKQGGEASELLREQRAFLAPAAGPGGAMLAVQVQGLTDSLWVYDLDRAAAGAAAPSCLIAEGDASSPVWTPDGRRITFRHSIGGRDTISWMNADGSGPTEVLFESEQSPTPCSWSPDGKTLALTQTHPHTGPDVYILQLDRGREVKPFVQSAFNTWGPRFSPDGRFIAYASDQSGRSEVYVQSFPSGPRWQVTIDGGTAPVWATNGGELFFRTGPTFTAVRIAVTPAFQVGRPRPTFEGAYVPGSLASPNYDVHPRTGQFILVKGVSQPESVTSLNVVLNWSQELRRRSSIIMPAESDD